MAAGPHGTKASQHYIFGCWSKSFNKNTIDGFWSIMLWSFRCMFLGAWPSHDWRNVEYRPGSPEATRAGTPLAGGRSPPPPLFVLSFCEFLYAPKSTSLKLCVLCRAERRGENTWHDHRDLAKWRATNWTSDCWFAWESRSQCALFSDPQRFVSGLFAHYDWMHCKYLG